MRAAARIISYHGPGAMAAALRCADLGRSRCQADIRWAAVRDNSGMSVSFDPRLTPLA